MMFSLCIVLMACGSKQQNNNSVGESGIKETESPDVTGASITEEETNVSRSSLVAKEEKISKVKKEKNNKKGKKYEEGKNPIDENKYFYPLFETDYKGTENVSRNLFESDRICFR